MPAGGLFSTAADLASFCRMILNNGELRGKRFLSQKSVREMTSRQTPSHLKESYGLGWMISTNGFGHGGAYATNMNIDPQRGLITIYLVQQAGSFPGNGKEALGTFRKAAEAKVAK
jgi:CubicO group peptidase (beta-lactamase class C family)